MKHIDQIVNKARQAYLDECTAANLSRNMSVETERIAAALEANRQKHGDDLHDKHLLVSDYIFTLPQAASFAVVQRVLSRMVGDVEPEAEAEEAKDEGEAKPRKRKAKAAE